MSLKSLDEQWKPGGNFTNNDGPRTSWIVTVLLLRLSDLFFRRSAVYGLFALESASPPRSVRDAALCGQAQVLTRIRQAGSTRPAGLTRCQTSTTHRHRRAHQTPHHTTQVHTKIGPCKRGLTIAQGRHARRILSPARHPGLDSPRPPGHLCTDPAVSLKYPMIMGDHHRAVPSPAGADWCLGRDAGDCGSAALVLGKTSCKSGSRSAPESRASQPFPPLGVFNPKRGLDNPGGGAL